MVGVKTKVSRRHSVIWSDFENTCGEGLASSPALRNQARKRKLRKSLSQTEGERGLAS